MFDIKIKMSYGGIGEGTYFSHAYKILHTENAYVTKSAVISWHLPL